MNKRLNISFALLFLLTYPAWSALLYYIFAMRRGLTLLDKDPGMVTFPLITPEKPLIIAAAIVTTLSLVFLLYPKKTILIAGLSMTAGLDTWLFLKLFNLASWSNATIFLFPLTILALAFPVFSKSLSSGKRILLALTTLVGVHALLIGLLFLMDRRLS